MFRFALCLFSCGLLLTPLAHGQNTSFLGKSAQFWGGQLGGDATQKRNAAFALGKIDSTTYLPQLIALFKDRDDAVRDAAVFAVGELCQGTVSAKLDENVLTALKGALKDQKPMVRRSAAYALGCMGDQALAAMPNLTEALNDPESAVRQNAAWALGRVGKASVDSLSKALRDEDNFVKRDAAGSLRLLKGDALPALDELLNVAGSGQSDIETKKAALGTLVELMPSVPKGLRGTAKAALTSAMAERDPEVKSNAAFALANMGGVEALAAVPVLIETLQGTNIDAKRQAAAAFKNIGPEAKAAVIHLRKALGDKDALVREYSAVGLTGIGIAATDAIPDLVKVVCNRSEKEEVRAKAAMALQKTSKSGEDTDKKQFPPVQAAKDAIKLLVEEIKHTRNPPVVRERTLWAMRVHGLDLAKNEPFIAALTSVVSEPKTDDNKMFRYDAAYLLGMLLRKDIPSPALDRLREYLHDDKVQIFVGTAAGVSASGEKTTGAADVKDTGLGDGRVIAMDALRQVGADVIKGRPDIANQIKALASTATDANLKAKCKDTVERFELK